MMDDHSPVSEYVKPSLAGLRKESLVVMDLLMMFPTYRFEMLEGIAYLRIVCVFFVEEYLVMNDISRTIDPFLQTSLTESSDHLQIVPSTLLPSSAPIYFFGERLHSLFLLDF